MSPLSSILFLAVMASAAHAYGGYRRCNSQPRGCGYNEVEESFRCYVLPGGECDPSTGHNCLSGYTCHPSNQTCYCDPTLGNEEFVTPHTSRCKLYNGGNCSCREDCTEGLHCIKDKCSCPFGTHPNPVGSTRFVSCHIRLGVRCKPIDPRGPTCFTGYCSPSSNRCECPVNTVYNNTTKTCDCTQALTYSTMNNCTKFANAICTVTNSSYNCACPEGALADETTRECRCPSDDFVLNETKTACICKIRTQIPDPENPADCIGPETVNWDEDRRGRGAGDDGNSASSP